MPEPVMVLNVEDVSHEKMQEDISAFWVAYRNDEPEKHRYFLQALGLATLATLAYQDEHTTDDETTRVMRRITARMIYRLEEGEDEDG